MNIGTGVERDSPLSKGLEVVLSQLKSVNVICQHYVSSSTFATTFSPTENTSATLLKILTFLEII